MTGAVPSGPLETAATEQELILRAQNALSRCHWEVGACAAQWTRRFAKGRTDADFGALVGLSSDQVYQRRRVWETFGDVCENYPKLKWSHFYSALNWDDAAECLQWANDVEATVAETKAWRRAQRGELGEDDDDMFEAAALFPGAEAAVQIPGDAAPFEGGRVVGSIGSVEPVPVMTGAARLSEEAAPYAPFHQGAISPPQERDEPRRPKEVEDPDVVYRRLTTAMERCATALSDGMLSQWDSLPEKTRLRFQRAAERLAERLEAFV